MAKTGSEQEEVDGVKVLGVERIEHGEERDPDAPLEGFERIMWWVIVVLSAAWIFVPPPFDPTDLFVPLGLVVDEFMAGMVMLTGLTKLGYNIPVIGKALKWYLAWKSGKGGSGGKK